MDTIKKDTPENKKKELNLNNEKQETVPGQQIGVYSEATKKEVQDVVRELNPDCNSLDSRG